MKSDKEKDKKKKKSEEKEESDKEKQTITRVSGRENKIIKERHTKVINKGKAREQEPWPHSPL